MRGTRSAPATRGRPRATAPRLLGTLLLAVCAALAVLLHHGLSGTADPMAAAHSPAQTAGTHSPAPMARAHAGTATHPLASAVRSPCAPAAARGSAPTDAACAPAHCMAPDVRAYQLAPPAMLPAGASSATAAVVPGAPRPALDIRDPSPPALAGLCVLRI